MVRAKREREQRKPGEFWCYRINGSGVNGVPRVRKRRQTNHQWWKRYNTYDRVLSRFKNMASDGEDFWEGSGVNDSAWPSVAFGGS